MVKRYTSGAVLTQVNRGGNQVGHCFKAERQGPRVFADFSLRRGHCRPRNIDNLIGRSRARVQKDRLRLGSRPRADGR